MKKRDVRVVELLKDWQDEKYWETARAETSDRSTGGTVSLEASLYPSIFWKLDNPPDQRSPENHGVMPIHINVRNSTKKNVRMLLASKCLS